MEKQEGQADSFDPTGATTPRVAPPLVRHMRAEICGVYSAGRDAYWPCLEDVTHDHSDVCGQAPALRPWWESTRTSAAADWTPWVLIEGVTCVGGPVPSGEQVLSEFRRLPIAPSVLRVQPDRGWVLVNKETIAYTDPVPQTLTATVLGVQVTFTVTPSTFTWDYGQKVFTTTSPGHPYPDQDVSYPYTEPGTGQVTLTTTWAATYTVDDDPTVRPVPGTATTTTTSPRFEIREASAHLTRGDCTQYPHDPGC
ncbi:MAG: hypothetical protein KJ792_03165 [Actinobacteria bacterium]|nr:hypothetical protein [Actinomycetota bacterium]